MRKRRQWAPHLLSSTRRNRKCTGSAARVYSTGRIFALQPSEARLSVLQSALLSPTRRRGGRLTHRPLSPTSTRALPRYRAAASMGTGPCAATRSKRQRLINRLDRERALAEATAHPVAYANAGRTPAAGSVPHSQPRRHHLCRPGSCRFAVETHLLGQRCRHSGGCRFNHCRPALNARGRCFRLAFTTLGNPLAPRVPFLLFDTGQPPE